MMDASELASNIKRRACELGFDACGVAQASPVDPEDRLGEWLAYGYQADMGWMERSKAVRQDAGEKLSGARSVVVVARNYYSGEHPHNSAGKVARYAWGRDYHLVLREPLEALAKCINELSPGADCYDCVDTGPVMEKAWAVRAGIGWQGKNSLVMNETLGSWFVLGAIITTAEIAPDEPVANRCGECRRCIEACPAGAIVAPGVVDAAQCISYQTIETKGELKSIHGWAFGCDACQEACPWNDGAKETNESAFQGNNCTIDLDTLSQEELRERFAETAIWRRIKSMPSM